MSGVLRPMSQMRKMETKEALFRARKRILRYLVLGFLKQEGCFQSAETFEKEAALSGEYQLCDNIDLDIILQDYCSYYLMRFNKQPQFCRKVEQKSAPARRPAAARRRVETPPEPNVAQEMERDLPSTLAVTSLVKNFQDVEKLSSSLPAFETKPLASFLSTLTPDRRELAEMLYQDIVRPTAVTWSDVQGLEEAKSLLMESIVYPVRYPSVFTGLLAPWRGVLLHGPPGAGKTLLARAVAAEGHCTFFNVSCSTLVHKWRGDSEKLVKVLFSMASYYSPSIIFMDEVECVASQRSAAGEHEASRRLKSQLLTELDGITERDGIVFLLANSNMPWEIDPAMLRRLEKRIHIPLPDRRARRQLFQHFLSAGGVELRPGADCDELAAKTDGYSGSDVKLVCKEALMANVRKMLPTLAVKGVAGGSKERLELSELLTAIEKTKPASRGAALRHAQWQRECGAD